MPGPALPLAIAGISALSQWLANRGGGDEEGNFSMINEVDHSGRSVDPRDLIGSGVENTQSALEAAISRLGQGVSLPSAQVQGVPTFTGGGLPMPIGLLGTDPAAKNPGLLSKSGVQMRAPSPMMTQGKATPTTPGTFSPQAQNTLDDLGFDPNAPIADGPTRPPNSYMTGNPLKDFHNFRTGQGGTRPGGSEALDAIRLLQENLG